MVISPQIEPKTTARLLACMGLVIEETKLMGSIEKSREMARRLEAKNPSSHRLIFLKKEISSLETRLIQVRSKADRI